MNSSRAWVSVCVAAVLMLGASASGDTFGTGDNQFTMDFVPISGSTNPTSGYGMVNNDFRMGTYEITNAQWDRFKAAYGTVTGNPSGAYDSAPFFTGTNVPTTYASWYEAAQFVNWLNTSTGHQAAYNFTGTRGTGDYTLAAWTGAEADNGTNLYRHKDAMYYLPSEDEWVKAAYWNGTAIQTFANASVDDLVFGEPDPAKWNYYPSATYEPWNVGSGGEELNGTFDMMGNVLEWMESPYTSGDYGIASDRGLRGGSYFSPDGLESSNRVNYVTPDYQYYQIGFRVASEVPEPASLGLLSLGGLMLLKRKRRA